MRVFWVGVLRGILGVPCARDAEVSRWSSLTERRLKVDVEQRPLGRLGVSQRSAGIVGFVRLAGHQ